MKNNFRRLIFRFSLVFANLFLIGCAIFSFSNSSEYKIDHFCYELNNFYKINFEKNTRPSFLKISSEEIENFLEYAPIFDQFHYSIDSNGSRYVVDGIYNLHFNNIDFNITTEFLTQPTFTIESKKDKSGKTWHTLDTGVFNPYFGDDLFGERKYLERRFGKDSFLFISDKMADKIIANTPELKDDPDCYRSFLTNEKFCTAKFTAFDGVEYSVCINNIIRTDTRNGSRAAEIYNDFSLLYLKPSMMESFNYSCDVDLKTNPYTNKKCIRFLKDFCQDKGTETTLFTFNNYAYSRDDVLNEKLKSILILNFDVTSNKFGFLFSILSLVPLLMIFFPKNNKNKYFAYFYLVVFLIIGLVANFLYIFPYFLIPTIFNSTLLIGYFISLVLKKIPKKNYYEIKV